MKTEKVWTRISPELKERLDKYVENNKLRALTQSQAIAELIVKGLKEEK